MKPEKGGQVLTQKMGVWGASGLLFSWRIARLLSKGVAM